MSKSLSLFMLTVVFITLVIISFIIGPPTAHSQATSITIDWTSPGDDGVVGTASLYEMRYSTVNPDTTSITAMNSWWSAATVVTGMPLPLIAGTAQSKVVVGTFPSGANYYFVIKTCDEVPNCSSYSNVAVKFIPDTLPPARIVDLRSR